MSKETESGSRGRKGKRGDQGRPEGQAGSEGEAETEIPLLPGHTTEEARKRAAGLIPSKTFAIIASDPAESADRRGGAPSASTRRANTPRESGYRCPALRLTPSRCCEEGILELSEEVGVRRTIKHMYRATEASTGKHRDWGDLAEALRPVFTGTILQDFSARVSRRIETRDLYSRDDFCLYWAPRNSMRSLGESWYEIYNWCIEESRGWRRTPVRHRMVCKPRR